MVPSRFLWRREGAARPKRAERPRCRGKAVREAWRRTATDKEIEVPDDVLRRRAAEEGPDTRGNERGLGKREGERGERSRPRTRGNHAPEKDRREPQKAWNRHRKKRRSPWHQKDGTEGRCGHRKRHYRQAVEETRTRERRVAEKICAPDRREPLERQRPPAERKGGNEAEEGSAAQKQETRTRTRAGRGPERRF